MIKNLFVLLLPGFFSYSLCHAQEECGGESRWEIKVLVDKESSVIQYSQPLKRTIHDLVSLSVTKTNEGTPRMDSEKKVYSVECHITEYRREKDKDLHLVLMSDDETMIAEIPNPDCPDALRSKHNSEFREARKTFEKYKRKGEYKKHLWRVTGVSFVDLQHSRPQLGVAKNDIELHPVLKLEIVK